MNLRKVKAAEDEVGDIQINSLKSRRQKHQKQRYNPFDSTTDEIANIHVSIRNEQVTSLSSQRQSYAEVTDEALLETITIFAKKYKKKMLQDACISFVAVTVFLLSLNIAVWKIS